MKGGWWGGLRIVSCIDRTTEQTGGQKTYERDVERSTQPLFLVTSSRTESKVDVSVSIPRHYPRPLAEPPGTHLQLARPEPQILLDLRPYQRSACPERIDHPEDNDDGHVEGLFHNGGRWWR